MSNSDLLKPDIRIIPPEGKYFTPQNKEYHSPTPGEITIVATTPNEGDQGPSNALCAELESCGFNSALMTITLSQVSQSLTICGNHGIRPFLFHSHLIRDEKVCSEYVNMFKNNPYLGGWNLKGQPTYNELSSPDDFRTFYEIISKQDPNHCIFVSLPGGAESSFMNGHSYKEYIELFQDVLEPSFFPYVLYPITGTDANPVVRYGAFFDDLEIFSLMAKYTERPFWAYVRSQSFKTSNGSMCPTPTEGQLRFAVFSALAYGAQGLVYWTYRQRENTNTEQYLIAPIDKAGNRTEIWNYVQKVNNEVKALNSIFCGADFIECRHTGDSQYRGTYSYALTNDFGPCDSIKSYGKGVLVSMLNNGGNNYLVIVNHDSQISQKIDIKFNDYWRLSELSIENNILNTHSVQKKLTRTIAAGSYLIFKWT